MAQNNVIARVAFVSGEAYARDKAGNLRRLRVGDGLLEGETVVTRQGAEVQLAFEDGRDMVLRANETLQLDAEVAAVDKPTATDSAIVDGSKGLDKITQALDQGGNLDDLLEAPAAGGTAAGDESHSFVRLLRIVETVDPLNFQFGTTNRSLLNPFDGAPALPVAAAAESSSGATSPPASPTVTIPDSNGAAAGDATLPETAGPTPGSFTVNAPAGLDHLTVGGSTVTAAQLANLGTTPITIVTAHGTLVLTGYNPATGVVSYTYDPTVHNINGPVADSIAVVVTDVLGQSSPADALDIVITDSQPVAMDDINGITEDAAPNTVSGSVLLGAGADTVGADANANPVTPVTNLALAHGTLTLSADGTYVYTLNNADPAVNALGNGQTLTDSYTYTLTDGDGSTTTATLTITINGSNDAPADGNEAFSVGEDTPLIVPAASGLLANSSDVDGGTPSITGYTIAGLAGAQPIGAAVPIPGIGTLTIQADGSFSFSPLANYNGPVPVVTYTVDDGQGGTDTSTLTLTVTPDNDPPVAVATPVSGDEDTPIPVSLTGTDIDGTIQSVTVTALPPASQGVLYLPDGVTPVTAGTPLTPADAANLIFRPAPDFNGLVNIPFTATDNDGATSAPAITPITVNAVVDPVISINDVTVNEAAGTMTFTVTLDQPTTATVNVNFATSPGTAVSPADFTATSGTLTFAPGVTIQTVTVPITNDNLYEVSETLNVVLSSPVNGTIGDGLGIGTITDDGTGPGGSDNDAPTLSVSNVSVHEGDGYAQFTVSLGNPSTLPTTVSLALTDGTAAAGSDYTNALEVSTDGGATWTAASSATFAPNTTSFLVRTPVTDDLINEANETFTLTATTTAGVTANASAAGTATILDNDGPPQISINDVTVNEGAGTITFTVSLTNPSAGTVTVDYGTAAGSATSPADYAAGVDALSGTLTFAPGVLSQTVTLSIANDTVYEGAETFNVNLSNASGGATLADNQGIGTILDDGTGGGATNDDRPQVASVTSPTIAEGGNLDFTVTLTNTSTTATTVTLTPVSGTAMLGGDTTTPIEVSFDGGLNWSTVSGPTVSVPAGAGSFIVRVPTVNDIISEPSETVTLSASTAQNAGPVVGTGTITDNDGTPSLAITGPALVNEAAGTLTYTVTLSNPSASTVTVNYGTANGTATAGSDYTATSGTLTFAPGVTSQTFTVAITNDSVYEGNETYNVNLSSPSNATIATGSVTTTIADDGTGTGGSNDDRPQVASVTSPTVSEGSNLDFTVTLTNTSTTPTTVTLTPASGTATLGTDTTTPIEVSFDGGLNWSTVSGPTVSVPAGTGSFIVRVPTVNDIISEPSETVTLSASTAQNAGPVVGTGTITDNDGTPSLVIDDVMVNEAAGTATFTVTLSNPSASTVTVGYNTSNGTATAGADYSAASGTLTFAPGVLTQTVTVAIANDSTYEGSETFNVNLTAPTNATLADALGIGTIRDDGTGSGGSDNDTPSLAVSSPTVVENAGYAQFTVSLSNPSASATTVNLSLANGTATSAADYTTALEVSTDGGTTWTPATSATFAPGATSLLVRTPIVNDTLAEPSETFTLTATTAVGTTSNPSATGTATITDNDTPAFSINDVTVNEGAGTITFTVSLTNPSAGTVTVDYGTAAGSATSPADYAAGVDALSGTLTFAPGVLSQTVTLSIANDTVYEGAETFNVNLSNATGGATIADNQGIGTIVDDGTGGGATNDDRPQVASVTSPTVAEGGNLDFTVTLTNTSTTATTVTLTPVSGTATLGTDTTTPIEVSFDGGLNWSTVSGPTVSVPAGAGSFIVRIPTVNDLLGEANETLTLSASTAQNAGPVQGTGTILDNDTPVINISGPVTYNEAAGTATFTVTLSNASAQTVSVNYGTVNGTATAGSDYAAGSGTLTFAPGVLSQTITVAITNDTVFEGAETFNVNLSTPANATLGTASSTATIIDDGTGTGGSNDDRPNLVIDDVVVNEGAGTATFTVTLSAAAAVPVTVGYNMNGVSATAGSDFTAGSGTLTFAAGVTSQTITVPIANDSVYEGAETFNVNLVSPTNATLADALGIGTIVDDGTGGGSDNDTPSLAVSSPTVVENAGYAQFTVSLSNPSASATTVNLSLANGTATSPADYTTALEVSTDGGTTWTAAGSATFAAGETSLLVRTPVVSDAIDENSETFTLMATRTGGTTSNASATGTATITDDDPTPTLAVNDVTVNEAAGTMTFTVSLSAASGLPVSVSYATSNGSATAGADYTAVGGTLNFAAGQTSQTITVPIANDATYEGAETLSVTLSSPVNATIADGSGVGTIRDDGTGQGGTDNDTPSLAVSSVTVAESAGYAQFAVSLSNPSATATTVSLGLSNGSAVSPADYTSALEVSTDGGTTWTAAASANFAAGQTSVLVRVPVIDDSLTENAETFTLTATRTAGTTSNASASGTATITDNDTPPAGRDIAVATPEDTPYVFGLTNFLMNDAEQGTDVDPSAVRVDTLPGNGILYYNGVAVTAGQVISAADIAAGLLVFEPAANANGIGYASFTFSVRDASGLYDTAPNTVTIDVAPVNDGAPVAANDNFATALGTPIIITAAQLLTNDTLRDHAQITGVSAVSSGTLVDNGNGTWTFTPSGTGSATFTYTLTDDDGQTSTATVGITTYAANNDLATVHESALDNGTGGGTRVATGNLLANDGGGTSISNVGGVTDGGLGDTDSRTGYIGVTTTHGKLVVDVSGTGVGDYAYTLNAAADNSAVADNNSITESFSYTSNLTTAALNVTIVDDRPLASNRTVEVSENSLPSYNLVLVLDVSGSMTEQIYGGQVRQVNDDGTVSITTRLDMAKAALISLVEEYFSQADSVSVKIVTFASTASILNGNVAYTSKEAAITAIQGITGSGGTDYSDALTAAQMAFGTVDGGVENIAYFISDGVPTEGDTSTPATSSGYASFVASNDIRSYAVGIGTGISNTGPLNGIHNVDADGSGAVDSAIIVPDLNELANTLLTTVPVANGGNVVGGGALGSALGADDGWVQNITLQLDTNGNGTPDTNVTFNYNEATNQISWSGGFPAGSPLAGDTLTLDAANGFTFGSLVFNFQTGEYNYFTNGVANEGDSFQLTFVAQDGDGDVTLPTTLQFEVVDGQPIARSDVDTLFANETSFTGNVISGMGTDGGLALGGLSTDFTSAGSGVDKIVDGATITSVTFQGQVFNLTTASSGSALGGNFTVSGGRLTWTHASNGSSLVFDSDGYYAYTPTAANTPSTPSGAPITVTLTGASASGTSLTIGDLTFTGIARSSTYETSGVTRSSTNGIGVTGGSANNRIDNLETLVITFNRTTNPYGVENVVIDPYNANSNLGNSVAVTYSIYHIDGHLLGQYYSNSESPVTMPSQYSNIGRIEVTANSDAYASIASVSYATVQNSAAAEIAPVQIGYTLTDTDGDTSSSTLTLRAITNSQAGDAGSNTLTGNAANDYLDGLAGNDTLDGGAGHDLLVGGAGNDSLLGGLGNDVLRGGTGDDTLSGGDGADVLAGGLGNDLLIGGAGSDTFEWALADKGAAGSPMVDTIQDFNAASAALGGDVLDLRDLLLGETSQGGVVGNLASFLHFEVSGGNTTVQISSSGGFSNGYNVGAVDQSIVLQGVDLTSGGLTDQQVIQDLLTKGKLVTD